MKQDSATNRSQAPQTMQPLDEATAFAELGRIVFAEQPLNETLYKVSVLAKRVLPETPEVSVTLIDGSRAHTAAFTGALAVQLDERQYADGFGPCVDAALSGQTIKLTMDDPDSPYQDFRAVAGQQGVTHTMSVALPVATRTVGALNIYNSTGRPFTEDSDRIAATFGGFAAILLANAGLYHDAVALAAQLKTAMQTRSVIEQAKGIVMAENHCSSEEAFKFLARLSQGKNMKLNVLAQALVDGTTSS